jgi:8-oxo-dGTP pyrophosphatase MutT (NUDIX family)
MAGETLRNGMTRAELDKAETKDFALGGKPMRPRDAATLILLDRQGANVRVLMGRRHRRHAFMPGKFVFPGGRTDPADSRIKVADGLHPDVMVKLTGTQRPVTPSRARAIALSALRETYEEAGLIIGRKGSFSTLKPGWKAFSDHDVQPALGMVRLIARAITPPGRVRRYDTRFLAVWRENIVVELDEKPTDELEELVWVPITDAMELDLPAITTKILTDLQARLAADPDLSPDGPVPFYRMRHNRFTRIVL